MDTLNRPAVPGARWLRRLPLAPESAIINENSGGKLTVSIYSKDFRVSPGTTVKLRKWTTTIKPLFGSKDSVRRTPSHHFSDRRGRAVRTSMSYPQPDEKRRKELQAIRKLLTQCCRFTRLHRLRYYPEALYRKQSNVTG